MSSGHANIMPFYDKDGRITAWKVHFSSKLTSKPSNRSFAFKKYGGKDEALKLAVGYRNTTLTSILNNIQSSL